MRGFEVPAPRIAGVVVGLTLVGTTVAAAIIMLRGYAAGFRYGGDSPWFVVSLGLAVLVTAAGAVLVDRQERTLAAWVVGSLWFYLVVSALAVQLAGADERRDWFAQGAVQAHLVGHILPVVLLQATFLLAAERLTGVGSRRLRIALIAYAGCYTLFDGLTQTAGSPYDGMQAPVSIPGVEAWGWVAAFPWMAAVVVGPVVVWRSMARARDRQRALAVGVASVVPLVTIVFCVLSALLASGLGILSDAAGEVGVALAFSLPFIVSPVWLALAPNRDGGRRLTPARASTVLSVAIGLSFAIVVVTASAIVGDSLGAGAVLPVVLGTLVIAAALTPVRRRLVRALLLRSEPERARAAGLLGEAAVRSDPGAAAQNILREALADPTALLLVELPNATWVDVEGNQAERPGSATAAEDRRVVLVHSAEVVNARGALDEVAPLLGQAVLEATIRDQSGRLAAEHDRAEVAAATERRRLERDLHDGVQGRLLALALDLKLAQRDLSDASAQLVLSDATTALTSAIGELRALAAGTTPELLSREGLQAALTDLTRRMPLPVAVTTSAGRLPAQVEIVAYLVVCEAITNTMKHADATMVSVEVRVESEVAVVVVSDDGRGGADLRAGTGLRGLSERVSSAGGTLVVSDRRPNGTTLEVTIPCGS